MATRLTVPAMSGAMIIVRTGKQAFEFDGPRHVRVGGGGRGGGRGRGRRLLYFAGCDYLRLSGHPDVVRAMTSAMGRRPLSSGASRITTGENLAYAQAERAIASFMRQPAAILVAAGYLAPIAALQALKSMATHVLVDRSAHACVFDGAKVSGLPILPFEPGNVAMLRGLLRRLGNKSRPVIACDGLRGTLGHFTPLASYLAELPSSGWMLVDDAHGFGAVGPGGRGTVAAKGLYDGRIVQTTSLSKALGLQGGAVIGPSSVIDAIYSSAPAFIGNTAPLVPLAVGVTRALRLLSSDESRVKRLQKNAAILYGLLPADMRVRHSSQSPICAVFPSERADALRLKRQLMAADIYPSWIRYLQGPPHGFFRFAVSSEHTNSDVAQLASAINAWAKGEGK